VGKALFWHAAAWARERGCRQLKIETQNINVQACRFYAAQGAVLGDLRRFAYADDPRVANEVQLNWFLAL
jgi:GNAT superfamily N-acetyltransferase